MNPPRLALLAAAARCGTATQAQDAGQLNVVCSVQVEWCNMIQTVFAKTTGIKVNLPLKGSGQALAKLIAEEANRDGPSCTVPSASAWPGA